MLFTKLLNFIYVNRCYRSYCSSYSSNFNKFCNIDVGVPQRSVLGPLLFLININDLQNNTSLKVLDFADNTLLYRTFNKNTYLQDSDNLNFELQKFLYYFKED